MDVEQSTVNVDFPTPNHERKLLEHEVTIRDIAPEDYPLLPDFVYAALFLPKGSNPFPRSILHEPELACLFENFGSTDDCGIVAEVGGKVVGLAWSRMVKSYGYVDNQTPELAIAVLHPYRMLGIGTRLLQSLCMQLRIRGYKQLSLSVQKENAALHLYVRLGFEVIENNVNDLVMLKKL